MAPIRKVRKQRPRKKGAGLVNWLIDHLPVEVHLPGGYQYCGPGTKLAKRLARGDPGINGLDKACKEHDIAYSKTNDVAARNVADRELADRAWERVRAPDASLAERAFALGVANIMKAKAAMGSGLGSLVNDAKRSVKKTKAKSHARIVGEAVRATRRKLPRVSKANMARAASGRIIPLPKHGGSVKTLAPIMAGLSALGIVKEGAKNVLKAVSQVRKYSGTGVSKIGKGLYLKPYQEGCGLFIGKKTRRKKDGIVKRPKKGGNIKRPKKSVKHITKQKKGGNVKRKPVRTGRVACPKNS